ncbi:hypothetical protein HPB51_019121 [Rhipicephalus microplus]|uniref:Tick transposon n=1 Tax=Rhipicephalus microplus TaxID=6941 RepID=A0A9J6DWP6_RHIMP|nr:hypothetical protein HPB51_019121 [Rhipicephalus microplus]
MLDVEHRGVMYRLFGLPRSSPIGPTLTETSHTHFCSEGNALPCDTYIECTGRLRDESLLPDCSIAQTQCVLQQETAAVIKQRLSGCLLIFTDGSVVADGAAAAACVIPALSLHGQYRLLFTASSTTAELTAIDLAADQLADLLPPTAAMLSDSRFALLALTRAERGVPLRRGSRESLCDCAEWL